MTSIGVGSRPWSHGQPPRLACKNLLRPWLRTRAQPSPIADGQNPHGYTHCSIGSSMRILLVAPQPFYQERGTPIAVRMLVEVLCGQGHVVDMLTYHEGADLPIEGLRILRTPALPGLRHVPIGISWKKLVCDLLLSVRLLGLALSHKSD